MADDKAYVVHWKCPTCGMEGKNDWTGEGEGFRMAANNNHAYYAPVCPDKTIDSIDTKGIITIGQYDPTKSTPPYTDPVYGSIWEAPAPEWIRSSNS